MAPADVPAAAASASDAPAAAPSPAAAGGAAFVDYEKMSKDEMADLVVKMGKQYADASAQLLRYRDIEAREAAELEQRMKASEDAVISFARNALGGTVPSDLAPAFKELRDAARTPQQKHAFDTTFRTLIAAGHAATAQVESAKRDFATMSAKAPAMPAVAGLKSDFSNTLHSFVQPPSNADFAKRWRTEAPPVPVNLDQMIAQAARSIKTTSVQSTSDGPK